MDEFFYTVNNHPIIAFPTNNCDGYRSCIFFRLLYTYMVCSYPKKDYYKNKLN